MSRYQQIYRPMQLIFSAQNFYVSADAEIQTDLKGGLTPQGETAAAAQSILIDRSIGLIDDITDGFVSA